MLRVAAHTAALALSALALVVPAQAQAASSADIRAAAASDTCAHADTPAGATSLQNFRASTLCLMNAQRTAYGLRALRTQARLGRAAGAFAREMVAKGFFAHESPAGSTVESRVKAARYTRHTLIGENIAWGTGAQATPRATVQAWMQSPPHRKNLLDGMYTEVGIGIAAGAPQAVAAGEHGSTYVTDFGRRLR